MEIGTVELTVNEIEHGMAFKPIDLIVADTIVPTADPVTGEVTGATGGRRMVWVDWTAHCALDTPDACPDHLSTRSLAWLQCRCASW
jgi:hypothetical protein